MLFDRNSYYEIFCVKTKPTIGYKVSFEKQYSIIHYNSVQKNSKESFLSALKNMYLLSDLWMCKNWIFIKFEFYALIYIKYLSWLISTQHQIWKKSALISSRIKYLYLNFLLYFYIICYCSSLHSICFWGEILPILSKIEYS